MRVLLILASTLFGITASLAGSDGPTTRTTLKDISPRNGKEELLYVVEYGSPQIRRRFPGNRAFLDEVYESDPAKGDFLTKFASIAARLNIAAPDVLIVYPAVDKTGNPQPQKPDAGTAWVDNIHGTSHNVILVTQYLQDGLEDKEGATADEQLLAVLAHETGHLLQTHTKGGEEKRGNRTLESEADAFALSCPEVNPLAFRTMVLATEKLVDEAARRHPLLYHDFIGDLALIPASVQTRMALGGDHPRAATRIAAADREITRRAALKAAAGH